MGDAVNIKRKIRVLVADDHPVMLVGLRATLHLDAEIEIVGEARDGAAAIEAFAALMPDVVLLDLQMPQVDGLQAISAIREASPDARIVVFTTYPGDARILKALSLGASGYLLKMADPQQVLTAIHRVFEGHPFIPGDVAAEMVSHLGKEGLTARELSVLKLVAEGNSNRDVGRELFISEETVKTHMRSIMEKLHAVDRTHAVTVATRRGFLEN